MKRSKSIVSFLNPLEVDTQLTTFEGTDKLIEKIPLYTVLPFDFFESALKNLPKYPVLHKGDWVEIGVWKGGGALFFKALMEDLGIKRTLYLFDTFGKIPTSNIVHAKDVTFVTHYNILENNIVEKNYQEDVERLFNEHRLNNNVSFIVEDINHLSSSSVPENITFLHLDVDFYEPTLSALNSFYDKIVSGGIIIIDDYYLELLNCKDAVDYFFEQRGIDLKTCSSQFSSYSIQIIKP